MDRVEQQAANALAGADAAHTDHVCMVVWRLVPERLARVAIGFVAGSCILAQLLPELGASFVRTIP